MQVPVSGSNGDKILLVEGLFAKQEAWCEGMARQGNVRQDGGRIHYAKKAVHEKNNLHLQ